MLVIMLFYGRIRAFMSKEQNFEHLQCTFPKLTETNQSFVLGLAEGLRQAQRKTSSIIPGNGEDKSERYKHLVVLNKTKTERENT